MVTYNGTILTMKNYWTVFENSDPAILDEIRLAILDNTNIGSFIDICDGDDYKLKQIRLALRENFPIEFLDNSLDAACIKELRYMYKNNINLNIVSDYLKLNNEALLYILTAVHKGADISNIDFNNISYKLIPIAVKGILYGYPMKFLEGHYEDYFDEDYIRLIFAFMQAGIDITPFAENKWDKQVLYYLLELSTNKIDVNYLLKYITDKCTLGRLEVLVKGYTKGVLTDEWMLKLCYRDEDGYYIYNKYQMSVLIRCIEANITIDKLFNPTLSDTEMLKLAGL